MGFAEAYEEMKKGKKVRRKVFHKDEYYYIDPMQGQFMIHLKNGKDIKYGNLNLLVNNILANDYEVKED